MLRFLCKSSARRAQDKTKCRVFCFSCRAAAYFGAAKVCKASAGQRKTQSFLFFLPSRRLLWRSKSVQGERKANISAYGPSGWHCSPEVGELRVAVRGMRFRSLERCYKFLTYPLRFARPPTLGGQLHPVCSHAAFACLYSHSVCSHAVFADLYVSAVSSLAAFSCLQISSVSLSLRAIRTVLLP